MSEYILQEDGASKFLLEDGSGALLEEGGEVDPSFIGSVTAVHAPTVAYTGTTSFPTVAGTYGWVCPAGISTVEVECIGAGGSGAARFDVSSGGGGGAGAYAARTAVPVTPGNLYTVTIGAGGAGLSEGNPGGSDGGSTAFTGDSSVQVIAAGGSQGTQPTGGAGGQASASTGDAGLVFDGGDGGDGVNSGGGGGASGNKLGAGADGSPGAGSGPGGAGGTGANGGGSGGGGGDFSSSPAGHDATPPGGGGGGAGNQTGGDGGDGADGQAVITVGVIAPFISSATVVYAPSLGFTLAFIGSITAVYVPTLSGGDTVSPPFIASTTRVYNPFSLFDPNRTYVGSGNGGETFPIRLAPNGVTNTATLAADIAASATSLELTGDASFPSAAPFVAAIDSEIVYLVQIAPGSYRIRGRGLSNTPPAAHTAGAVVSWGDSYDQAIIATAPIDGSFTADVNGTGSTTYPGWLMSFDSTQAYLGASRYPAHVAELLGVFDADAGSTGSNRCDAAQPNAIATASAASDDCPAALGNPSRIQADIASGDVALVRYTNPEASVLDLGPRSVALQSWFGLKRVDATDADVTFTDPNGIVVDTTGAEDTFTGSVNGEWFEPSSIGISPDTGDPTPNASPYTTVTLPGTDRFFTFGPPGFSETGWPIGVLSVRQGDRRIPHWKSFDWHDYSYVYTGFGTDDTFAQVVVNRNGIVFDSLPEVELPGPQDIHGPDAVWDDATYYFGVSWYVAIFGTPYLVMGPTIGGTPSQPQGGGQVLPTVTFSTGTVTVAVPGSNPVEGGSGGDITGNPGPGLFQAAAV